MRHLRIGEAFSALLEGSIAPAEFQEVEQRHGALEEGPNDEDFEVFERVSDEESEGSELADWLEPEEEIIPFPENFAGQK